MEKYLEEIEKNALLVLSNWWGLGPTPGNRKIIVTNDKKIYYYHNYYRLDKFLKEANVKPVSLSKGRQITDEQYNRIISFIEEKIIDKEFKNHFIFDVGYNVIVNYQGIKYNISNDIGYENKEGLYDIASKLIKEIEGELKNEKE